MSAVVSALSDCAVVLAAKAGPGAIQHLSSAGIEVFGQAAPVDDALKKLATYYARAKL